MLKEDAEKTLADSYTELMATAAPLLAKRDYSAALSAMLVLKAPVDEFFNHVMVMDEDEAVRRNRLNLLTGIATLFLGIGDISKMQNS